jgi:tetratricopeptide (TPR) repeat protein
MTVDEAVMPSLLFEEDIIPGATDQRSNSMRTLSVKETGLILGVLLLFAILIIVPAGAAMNDTPIIMTGENIDAINAYNQGADLAAQGKFQEALQATDKALSIQPNFSLAWAQKAGLLVVLGKASDAVSAADNAIAGNQNITEAWANRADALISLGKYKEALESANRAITLDPTLKSAQESKKLAQAMLDKLNSSSPVPTTKAPASPLVSFCGILVAGVVVMYHRKRRL